jgi:homoserine dehydrogenase
MHKDDTLDPIRVGLVGLGTVAQGTLTVLARNADEISRRIGRPLVITHVGARRDRPEVDLSGIRVSRDLMRVAEDPDVDVFVELIGGTDDALSLIEVAIRSGKHVVTANKALIAVHGNRLFQMAEDAQVMIGFEASVAGGIPVIKAIREGLAANQIAWLAGIINGTGNFILTAMREEGRTFVRRRRWATRKPTRPLMSRESMPHTSSRFWLRLPLACHCRSMASRPKVFRGSSQLILSTRRHLDIALNI